MFSKQVAIIIDRDRLSSKTILRVLKDDLYFKKVTIVSDGRDARDLLKSGQVDWVFAEQDILNMPKNLLLKELRNNPQTVEVPYLMLSNQVDRKSLSDAISLGITDFIAKPFTPATISAKVRRIMHVKEKRIAPRVTPIKNYHVEVTLRDDSKAKGIISNISATGLLVSMPRLKKTGMNILESLNLVITIDNGVTVPLESCLARMECDYNPDLEAKTHILCAFDFDKITSKNRVILTNFINEQRRLTLLEQRKKTGTVTHFLEIEKETKE